MPISPAGKNTLKSLPFEQRTSGVVATTLAEFPTYAGGAYQVKAFVLAKSSVAMNVGGWEFTGTFKNVSGTLSIVGVLDTIDNHDSTLSATLTTSGNKIILQATGVAATAVVWEGELQVKALQLQA